MEPFDQKGALNDALGHHPSKNIPAALSWEQMGPQIQAKLAARKKRRRVFWWWLSFGVVTITAFYYLLTAPWPPIIAHFPVAVGHELIDEIAKGLVIAPASEGKTIRAARYLTTTAMDLPSATRKVSRGVSEETTFVHASSHGKTRIPSKEKGITTLPVGSDAFTDNPVAVSLKQAAEMSTSGLSEITDAPVLNIITLTAYPLSKDFTEEVQGIVEKWAEAPSVVEPQLTRYWQIEVGIGANSYRSLENNTSSSSSTRNPQALNGFTGSLLAGRRIGAGVYSLWTGFSYQELVQRERFEDEFVLQLYQPNTLDTIYRNLVTGEETLVYTDSVAGVRRIDIQQHNFFRTYAIPVTLRRQWDHQKWPLALQMGVDVNWSQWKKGKTLAADAQLEETNTAGTLGLGLRLGAQVYSPRTRFGRLFFGVSYQRFLKEYSGTLNGRSFRPETINLMIGVPLGK